MIAELFLGLIITLAWDAPEGPVAGYLLCENSQCQNIGNVTETIVIVNEFPTILAVKPYDQDGVEGEPAILTIGHIPSDPQNLTVK